jgi:transposase
MVRSQHRGCRSRLARACWTAIFDPTRQRTFFELANHFGTAVVPARPGRSRDMAKVEGAVLIAQRWMPARLRPEMIFSLRALIRPIAELLEDLHGRPR